MFQILQIRILHVFAFLKNGHASHATSICIAYAIREETGEPEHSLGQFCVISTNSFMQIPHRVGGNRKRL